MGWKSLDIIAYTLLNISAIGWAWMGLFGVDPVALMFGNMTRASKLVYSLICLAAFYDLRSMPAIFRTWAGFGPQAKRTTPLKPNSRACLQSRAALVGSV